MPDPAAPPATVLHDYWRSSASYRVRIGLSLLGIEARAVRVDLRAGEQHGAANLAVNPQGLVPTLEIDGLVLTQSLAILEYLEETRTAGWLPEDAPGRTRVRALAHAIAMEIHPVCNLSVARFATDRAGGGLTTEDWMRHFIGRGLAGFEALLAATAGRYCHGDRVTLADIVLVPQLYNAARWQVDATSFPRAAEIGARLAALPAFAAAHPDRHNPDEARP
jgi:maleylacetoacetate isomerase